MQQSKPHRERDAAAATRSGSAVAVVTGASAGLGRAIAGAFAEAGWRVALIARGEGRLESAARELRAAGAKVLTFATDVADAAAIDRAADQVVERWGGIDVWVNNAMVTVFGRFESMSASEFRRVTEVTFLGQVNGTRAALRHMRRRNAGTIVQMDSALGYRSIPLQSAYCAAKAAVRGFTDSLRSELIHEGSRIRLTTVYLPAINTPQFDWARCYLPRHPQPVGTIFQPEAVARRVVRAAVTAPRERWIGRTTLLAVVGNMVFPGWLDRMMARKAWSGQMTARRIEAPRSGNLYEPVNLAVGSHGDFDARARARVGLYSPKLVRAGIAAVVALGFVSIGALLQGSRTGRSSA